MCLNGGLCYFGLVPCSFRNFGYSNQAVSYHVFTCVPLLELGIDSVLALRG
jgi:hypothetical protein